MALFVQNKPLVIQDCKNKKFLNWNYDRSQNFPYGYLVFQKNFFIEKYFLTKTMT